MHGETVKLFDMYLLTQFHMWEYFITSVISVHCLVHWIWQT